MLTYGGHLEVLRQMLFRILGVAGVISCVGNAQGGLMESA